jgi:formylglycine-generating enzyme required for sulfatase activity
MVVVPAPSGTKYCVDRTEVTQAHYQQFLASTKTNPGTEHADCSENASYAPAVYPSSKEGATCITDVSWNPQKTPQRPVVCIDWCDAQAYCQWAGKRLCGKIGGGRLTITGGVDVPGDPANDASQSQWFNACSQGGKTAYPYGAAHDPAACESAVTTENWQQTKKDVGARPGCHGAQQPWSSLRDLSGSVAEMTDECVLWTDPAKSDDKPTLTCAQRGGSVVQEKSWLGCALAGTTSPYTAYPDLGFRCCKDL